MLALWLYKEMRASYTISSQQWHTREAEEQGCFSEDSGEHPSFAYSWEADLGCAWEGLLGTSQISEGQGSAGLWIWNAREAEGRIRATGVQAHGVLSPFFHHSSQNKVLAEGSRVKAVSKDTRIKSKHGQALLFSMHLIILFLQLPSPQLSFSICQSNCLATEQIRERICSIEEETNKPFTVHPQSDRRWSPLPHLRHQPTPDSHHKSKSAVEFPSEFRHLSQELTQTWGRPRLPVGNFNSRS